MTCDRIERELIAYQLGLVSSDVRNDIEAHLMTCSVCLRAFLDVKRAVELGEDAPRPSAESRARLRRAVAKELQIEPERRALWWERPVAFAFAATALMAAMLTMRALTSGPGTPPYAMSTGGETTGRR